ncbi:MBL fold metallo-hydrolase [Shewanella woodyi]|uniref:Zn-dependent hydrolase of the beta-lactamase fold n=1 Tax=Shewanella woodyi (strain ATCC 51908 / MS32) TaxID=392500 RepID=B1KQ92_SHEWM|nr:MBL fold metallo-hydrolase [Shewanella woodyi]ACA84747.1 Zn-dependent hydrolase of the beta-lactamase fold [Shewanella woodyi ATCC 51908]
MKPLIAITLTLIFGGAMLTMTTSSIEPSINNAKGTHHSDKGGYINTAADFTEETAILPLLMRYATEKRVDAEPEQMQPIIELTSKQLMELPSDQDMVIRLGHSSIFMQLDGKKWLIDPVFSERASPFSFIGPKRFHPTPISLKDLPEIDGVLISHDHYDHLDKATIKHLASTSTQFIVPLGVDKHLLRWGVAANKVQSLDWWESFNLGSTKITAMPTQHFSGRGIFDKNETLWASYVIESQQNKIYFSGDSGYFAGFKEIGDRFGPFTLTMVETGAYDADWPTIHMTPEQSLQAHIDLRGETMMPIHNGTFDLAFHSWYEPLERIVKLANDTDVKLATPMMGQGLTLKNNQLNTSQLSTTEYWWRTETQREMALAL